MGLNWFFENVEQGIILEDDCVPNESFFPFCQELLERYRDDLRVMQISGTNYLFDKKKFKASYYFTKLNAGQLGAAPGIIFIRAWTLFLNS